MEYEKLKEVVYYKSKIWISLLSLFLCVFIFLGIYGVFEGERWGWFTVLLCSTFQFLFILQLFKSEVYLKINEDGFEIKNILVSKKFVAWHESEEIFVGYFRATPFVTYRLVDVSGNPYLFLGKQACFERIGTGYTKSCREIVRTMNEYREIALENQKVISEEQTDTETTDKQKSMQVA